jgi:hypothetical protein
MEVDPLNSGLRPVGEEARRSLATRRLPSITRQDGERFSPIKIIGVPAALFGPSIRAIGSCPWSDGLREERFKIKRFKIPNDVEWQDVQES